jgi:hypothetical protein
LGIVRAAVSGQRVAPLARTRGIQRFRLALDNDRYSAYAAVVETAEGNEIRRVDGLKCSLLHGNKVVDVRVSSRLIRAGDYVIRLKGTPKGKAVEEELDVYGFRAVNR